MGELIPICCPECGSDNVIEEGSAIVWGSVAGVNEDGEIEWDHHQTFDGSGEIEQTGALRCDDCQYEWTIEDPKAYVAEFKVSHPN